MIGPIEIFQTEAKEHLALLESALLALEDDPNDLEVINQAFRSIHTIKGAAGMYGYQDLTHFTHHLESVLDQIRAGKITINSPLVGVFLDAGDLIASLLIDTNFTAPEHLCAEAILGRLHNIVGASAPPLKNSENASFAISELMQHKPAAGALNIFKVNFTPDTNTFKSGLDVVPILRELHGYGECFITTRTASLPTPQDIKPQQCYLSWEIVLITVHLKDTIQETFMFVEDDWAIYIDEISLHELSLHGKTEEDFHLREALASAQLSAALWVEPPLAPGSEAASSAEQFANPEHINATLAQQKAKTAQMSKSTNIDETIRVSASRLDSLMNLVGELVIVQARLNQFSGRAQNAEISAIAEELDMLTTDIRTETFGIRMVPIGSTFGRFKRLVRDLSKELDKKIVLTTFGAQTELDKMVIDKLSDPLIHLIRNSIDHGIESPAQRLQSGKPETGSIELKAMHADSQVIIEITDDGKGLDKASILRKALDKGVIQSNHNLSDNDIHMLIFEPGLSTAKTVSDISGRGVGMDVVKRSIADLGGKVSIQSRPGKGTTLTINLPMTLAIIEGLMVVVDKERYVLPLSCIEECIELPCKLKNNAATHSLVEVRGTQIPFLNLRGWFKVNSAAPPIEQVVIVHIGAQKFGFRVDEVIGQYQTVIKRLGKLYEGVAGFSGATILGDGTVAMILDPHALMESSQQP